MSSSRFHMTDSNAPRSAIHDAEFVDCVTIGLDDARVLGEKGIDIEGVIGAVRVQKIHARIGVFAGS